MNVLILITLGVIFCLDMSRALAQIKAPISQQAGDCSVTIAGSGNNASLVCNNLDPRIAEQVRAILNSSQRNEKATKDISQKLDLILKEISKRPTPRRLTPKQRAELVLLLSGKVAQPVEVDGLANNAESMQYAEDLAIALQEAGWQVKSLGAIQMIGRVPVGLHIFFKDESDAHLLAESFRKVGLEVTLNEKPQRSSGIVTIIVGVKPE